MSVARCPYAQGLRTTSEKAFLADKPDNLTIWTQSPVARIALDGKNAVGVETIGGILGIF
jgi:hypothetical protein